MITADDNAACPEILNAELRARLFAASRQRLMDVLVAILLGITPEVRDMITPLIIRGLGVHLDG